jgi:hypothetical protein
MAPQDRPLRGQQPHCADLVGFGQAAEPGHVGCQDGGKSAFNFINL